MHPQKGHTYHKGTKTQRPLGQTWLSSEGRTPSRSSNFARGFLPSPCLRQDPPATFPSGPSRGRSGSKQYPILAYNPDTCPRVYKRHTLTTQLWLLFWPFSTPDPPQEVGLGQHCDAENSPCFPSNKEVSVLNLQWV